MGVCHCSVSQLVVSNWVYIIYFVHSFLSCFSSLLFLELSLSQPMNFNNQPPTLQFSSILVWGEGSKQMAVRCSDACQVKSQHTHLNFLKVLSYTAMYTVIFLLLSQIMKLTKPIKSEIYRNTVMFLFLLLSLAALSESCLHPDSPHCLWVL